MSLLATPIDQIGFPEVDTFLSEKIPEGIRLDYKADMPSELEKVVSAFANTIGGTIIIGVEENSSTNEPVWPPSRRQPSPLMQDTAVKIRDQIFNRVQTNIYPPVPVHVSRVISNQHAPGRALVVIRVDMSKDAPHAVEKKQKVYIAEKAANTSDRFTLAEIDRIEQMLKRRSMAGAKREEMISESVRRCSEQIRQYRAAPLPVMWAAFTPYYPWHQVCDQEMCHSLQQSFNSGRGSTLSTQRVPGGSYGHQRRDQLVVGVTESNDHGHCFVGEDVLTGKQGELFVNLSTLVKMIASLKSFILKFYGSKTIREQPGLAQLSIGFERIKKFQLYSFDLHLPDEVRSRNPSILEAVRLNGVVDAAAFIADPIPTIAELLAEIEYAFDADKTETWDLWLRNWDF